MLRSALLLALLTACSKGDDTSGDTDTDLGVDSEPGDTAAPLDTDCSDDVPADGAGLAITAVDADGNVLGADRIQLRYCRGDKCTNEQCAQDDAHRIGGLDAGVGSLELFPKPTGDAPLATAFAPFTVTDGEVSTLTVTVPRTGTPVDLPATRGPIEVADGLYLTLEQGDLEGATPLDPAPTAVSGVDATDVALPIEGLQGTVLAVWYLDPFDAEVADGSDVTVSVDDRWSLGSGNGELYVGDYYTSSWVKVGDLVTDGDKLSASGLPRISTLVVIRKPDL
jgi:hypothetical protein